MKRLFGYALSAAASAVATCAAIIAAQDDCAITINRGAAGGTISGFHISGHSKGICASGGTAFTVSNNVFEGLIKAVEIP